VAEHAVENYVYFDAHEILQSYKDKILTVRELGYRIALLAPGIQAAFQRANVFDALPA
jgi:hypothetical protein